MIEHDERRLLEARDLTVTFPAGRGRGGKHLVAVDHADLVVHRREIVGLVGESGSGKSTLARAVVGLQPAEGRLFLEGRPLAARRTTAQRRAIQMVFQDPFASLDPRMTVRAMLREVLLVHRLVPRPAVDDRCRELMADVRLPEELLDVRPAGMSGGQRQRVAIARALAVQPRLLIADEATSALDVSVQAEVIALLADLADRLGLAVLFIAHDLAVVRTLCDRVAVIYHGVVVETGETTELFARPRDPYTRRLLDAVPRIEDVLGEPAGDRR